MTRTMDDDCEHEVVDAYTYSDWWDTGIPEGAYCRECGDEMNGEAAML
jgi:hypothetical protein